MTRKDLTSFEIEDQGFKLKIARASETQSAAAFVPHMSLMTPQHHAPAASAPAAAPAPAPIAQAEALYIKSPIVGTFYASATPDSAPYVKVGSVVSAKTVVCIIEAMKVMNEITAELSGEVLECMLESGSPVEYGQPLFRIKKL